MSHDIGLKRFDPNNKQYPYFEMEECELGSYVKYDDVLELIENMKGGLKLYHIWQKVNNMSETYSSAIVCANNEDDARYIHPNGFSYIEEWWNNKYHMDDWTSPENVHVELIADSVVGDYKAGDVIISDYIHA